MDFTKVIAAVCLLLAISPATGGRNSQFFLQSMGDRDTSNDRECKQPVCWAGDNEGKSCYICEYGKKTQHIVCSSKGSTKDKYYNGAVDLNKDKDHCPAPSDSKAKYRNRMQQN